MKGGRLRVYEGEGDLKQEGSRNPPQKSSGFFTPSEGGAGVRSSSSCAEGGSGGGATEALNKEAGWCSTSRGRAPPKANFSHLSGGHPSLAYTGCLISKKKCRYWYFKVDLRH